ncbi:hypothetical protein [Brevundimonas sp. NIBR11]|uniref:hypothetical protein n=1 Tax=Brevundimonas sp. NIBR11 TaxID=3015999 RepID=UPI0022F0BF27|nr:hypothetical protein [Brevundimonas sp. NIBR11]
MTTKLLLALSLVSGLSGCVTGTALERCQAAAAKHGYRLGPSDRSEIVIDAEALTEVWLQTARREAAQCTVRENRLVFLQVGDRVLVRR